MIQDFDQYSYVIIDTSDTVEVKGGFRGRSVSTKAKYETVDDIEQELNANGQAGYAFCNLFERDGKTLIILQSKVTEHGVPVEWLISMINSMIEAKSETSRAYVSSIRTQETAGYVAALTELANNIGLEGVTSYEQAR